MRHLPVPEMLMIQYINMTKYLLQQAGVVEANPCQMNQDKKRNICR